MKSKVMITGFVLLVFILALGAGLSDRPVDNKDSDKNGQVRTGVYESPVYSNEITLTAGTKPAWVYSAKNRLYVSYFGKERVEILDMQGQKIDDFTTYLRTGRAAPQNMGLIGERLLVADYGNRALSVFTPDGKYIEAFNQLPNGEGFVPVGVAVYNRVFYVTDTSRNGWMAMGEDGEIINVVKGTDEKSNLLFPAGIVVTEDGRVVITDPKGGRVKVFTCAGWYAYDFPAEEIGLQSPQGIALDGYGRIHVVDNGAGEIVVYDNRGHYLFKYGSALVEPTGITVDPQARKIYVTNTGKSSISVWSY